MTNLRKSAEEAKYIQHCWPRKIENDLPLDVTSKSCTADGILSRVHRNFGQEFWPLRGAL